MPKMFKKLWIRGIAIGLIASLIAGTLFGLSFRVSVKPADGVVSISFAPQVVYAATERQSPDAILEIVNLTGTVSEIQDDPDSPDADWLVIVEDKVDTSARVSFSTPTGNPTVGADLQEFRALVRKTAGSSAPEARIELWENGNLIRAGSENSVTGNLVISFTWNANEISNADGSLVECKIFGTASRGNPANRATVEVGAVEWNVDYSAGSPDISVSPVSYDFGVIQASSTTNTTTNYFTITNNSGIQTDQTISVTTSTWSGGLGWDHSDTGTAGDNTTAIYAYRTAWNVIVKNASPNFIYENCPASTSYDFGLSLQAPTVFYDGAEKTITIRITAAAG